MCQLFAYSSLHPTTATAALAEFFGNSVDNPHGWGVAWHEGDEVRMVKEPIPAYRSTLVRHTLDEAIESTHILAHIRKATHGTCAYDNCHPFVQTDSSETAWTMIHNGVIVNDALLAGYDSWEVGETDSECVLMFLVDVIDEAMRRRGHELSFDEKFEVLGSAFDQLSNGNKLNLVLDDGQTLFIHTNTLDTTLYVSQNDDAAMFCTVPLTLGDWTPIPQRRLVAYRQGRLVRASHVQHVHSFDSRTVRYLQLPEVDLPAAADSYASPALQGAKSVECRR
ncbi:class II glutamine amidotransferase [Slackia exigua]